MPRRFLLLTLLFSGVGFAGPIERMQRLLNRPGALPEDHERRAQRIVNEIPYSEARPLLENYRDLSFPLGADSLSVVGMALAKYRIKYGVNPVKVILFMLALKDGDRQSGYLNREIRQGAAYELVTLLRGHSRLKSKFCDYLRSAEPAVLNLVVGSLLATAQYHDPSSPLYRDHIAALLLSLAPQWKEKNLLASLRHSVAHAGLTSPEREAAALVYVSLMQREGGVHEVIRLASQKESADDTMVEAQSWRQNEVASAAAFMLVGRLNSSRSFRYELVRDLNLAQKESLLKAFVTLGSHVSVNGDDQVDALIRASKYLGQGIPALVADLYTGTHALSITMTERRIVDALLAQPAQNFRDPAKPLGLVLRDFGRCFLRLSSS